MRTKSFEEVLERFREIEFHETFDLIVAIANGWWAKDASIPAIQRSSVEAWARLFDLPLVTAFNR